MIGGLLSDLRSAGRSLRKRPLFALSAGLTLALGIGATTALWSVVDAVLLRPMPYPGSERLVAVQGYDVVNGSLSQETESNLSSPDVADLRAQGEGISGLAAYSVAGTVLGGEGEPIPARVGIVTPGFFSTLGVAPALGRDFSEEEHVAGKHRVLLLSDALWRARFQADPGVVGRKVLLAGNDYTILGVLPRGFMGPLPGSFDEPVAWRPLAAAPDSRGGHWLRGVARLAPGVTREAAEGRLGALMTRLQAQYPDTATGQRLRLVPLVESASSGSRPAIVAVFGAVLFLLLIACFNVAGLLLARTEERRRETAIRAAIGAGRGRLMSLVFCESGLLALGGALVGMLFAWWGTDLLATLAGHSLPRVAAARIDARALLFALAVSTAAALVFGMAPAARQARVELDRILREGHGAFGASRRRMRQVLVVGQLALSLVLLIGAGLMATSVGRLLKVPTGLRTENVLTFELQLPRVRYPDGAAQNGFAEKLVARLEALPGVQSAGLSNILPMSGSSSCDGFSLAERPQTTPGPQPCAEARSATPRSFAAFGIPLVRGRLLEDRDDAKAPKVAVVNEAFSARFLAGDEAIGKHLVLGDDRFEIVGVIGDVKQFGPAVEAPASFTLPFAQSPGNGFGVAVHATLDAAALAPAVRREVTALDAGLALERVETMRNLVRDSAAAPHFRAIVTSAFATAALLLAAVGLYGLMTYTVGQRRREIGIRMALGAERGAVARLVFGEALGLLTVGTGIGLLAGAALTPLLGSLLFGVRPLEPALFLGPALVLAATALLSSLAPAWRATRVDPLRELRVE
jgi:putative ABC transport system permease protein